MLMPQLHKFRYKIKWWDFFLFNMKIYYFIFLETTTSFIKKKKIIEIKLFSWNFIYELITLKMALYISPAFDNFINLNNLKETFSKLNLKISEKERKKDGESTEHIAFYVKSNRCFDISQQVHPRRLNLQSWKMHSIASPRWPDEISIDCISSCGHFVFLHCTPYMFRKYVIYIPAYIKIELVADVAGQIYI